MTDQPVSAAASLLREQLARARAQIEQREAEHDGPGHSWDEPEANEPEAGA
jgi:hypothetical protein